MRRLWTTAAVAALCAFAADAWAGPQSQYLELVAAKHLRGTQEAAKGRHHAHGKAAAKSSLLFVSKAYIGNSQARTLERLPVAVENTRGGIGKHSMVHNSATPHIEVNAETYEVRADGELLTCEPATVLPMAQRYFLF